MEEKAMEGFIMCRISVYNQKLRELLTETHGVDAHAW
ncbi:hypothetical protein GBAR_LOCUS14673, partial [Geodia barretti]